MRERLRKTFNRAFHITLLISIVTVAIPLTIGLTTTESHISGLIWIAAYANFYVLWPVLLIALVGLLIVNFKYLGFINGIKESSLNILILIVSLLVVYLGISELKFRENQIKVVIKNNTFYEIKNIKLHGRNALTELDILTAKSDTSLIFRGKNINYKTENDFENEVTLLYYMDSTWFRQPVLEGFSRWTVFNGPFKLVINGSDSVEFEYLPKNKP